MKTYLFKPENREINIGSEVTISGYTVRFSKDLAKKYPDLFEKRKKVILTTEDGVNVHKKKDIWWVRYNKNKVNEFEPYLSVGICDGRGFFDHDTYKYFYSRMAASEYVENIKREEQ